MSCPRAVASGAVLGALLLFTVMVCTGSTAVTSAVVVLIVAWQAWGGLLLWLRVRPDSSWLELSGMGLALGTAFGALAGLATSTFSLGPWGCLVPTVVVTVGWVAGPRHRRTMGGSSGGWDGPETVGLLAALVPGLAILAQTLRSYPLQWSGVWSGYHPDMAFFQALATSLARFGAFESPFMSGGVVRYHWLSYAWTGQLSQLSDAEPFVGLTRVLPVVALLGSAALVAAWTRRLSPHRWTPALAGLLLSIGGFTGAVFGGVLTMDSPSQSMGVLWLIGFVLVAVEALRRDRAGWLSVAVLTVMSSALVGGKVSAAAPAIAAVVLTCLLLALRGAISVTRAATVAGLAIAAAALAFLAFLAGSVGGGGLDLGSLVDRAASQQGLNPMDGLRGVLAGTIILALAVLPRWTGVGWLVTRAEWRWRPETLLSWGLAGSSLAALLAFNSFNELWFSSTVSGPLAATTAVGAGVALDDLHRRPRPSARTLIVGTAVGALVIFGLVTVLWTTGASGGNVFVPTLRWAGPIAAWGAAVVLGLLLCRWGWGRVSLRGGLAGIVLLLVFVSVPGRLLGLGTGQVGQLTNGLRGEWFSFGEVKSVRGLDTQLEAPWTSTRLDAAEWLRSRAEATDLLATNLTLWPLVAGLTGLPTYVSGVLYQGPYGPPWMSPELLAREAQVWGFIDRPSLETVSPLCTAGVAWLWIDLDRTDQRRWEPWATIVHTESDTFIAKLDQAACPHESAPADAQDRP